MEFHLNVKALRMIGILVHKTEQPSRLLRAWRTFLIAQYVILHLLVGLDLINATRNVYYKLMSTYNLFVGCMTLLKTAYFEINKQRIGNLIELIDGNRSLTIIISIMGITFIKPSNIRFIIGEATLTDTIVSDGTDGTWFSINRSDGPAEIFCVLIIEYISN
jgi:hypothetical protein